MAKAVCKACGHDIDAAARLCPYCGADPHSGEKPIDTQAILQEEFHPRHVTPAQGLLEYARQRQGWVVVVAALVIILFLAGVHEIVAARNQKDVSGAAAVPLTDIADLNSQSQDTQNAPMPKLQYQYDGNPQTMRTLIVEPGAVAPAQATTTAAPPRPSR